MQIIVPRLCWAASALLSGPARCGRPQRAVCAQLRAHGRHVGLNLLRAGRARDDRGHGRATAQPGEGELEQAATAAAGERGQSLRSRHAVLGQEARARRARPATSGSGRAGSQSCCSRVRPRTPTVSRASAVPWAHTGTGSSAAVGPTRVPLRQYNAGLMHFRKLPIGASDGQLILLGSWRRSARRRTDAASSRTPSAPASASASCCRWRWRSPSRCCS
jgi:hypothetical protein